MRRVARVEAPAKVNLALRVTGRRPDGYHDLETLFQSVDLCDDVVVELAARGTELEVIGAELGPPEENLAFRAAEAYRALVPRARGVRVTLHKRIPAGAGLGGGSSDAAAVLRCLDALHDGAGGARLAEVAAGLGSDVPFFLRGAPLAWGTGRGEVLRPLPPLPAGHVVIALPPVHVASGDAYGWLAAARSGGAASRGVGRRATPARTSRGPGEARPDAGHGSTLDWDVVRALAHNDFEEVVAARHPEVARSLVALRGAGATLALLTGSGCASFGLFAGEGEAVAVAARLAEELGWRFLPARTRAGAPEVRTGP